jgi:DNA-nicking Smr family endonuclease
VKKRAPDQRDDEDEEFARAMEGVRRLVPDPRGRVRAKASPEVPQPAKPEPQLPDESDSGFAAPGVDRRELRKLKRGEYVPGDRLDLHGMTAAEAVTKVKAFVDTRRTRHRCIAIVHGRGLHSEGNVAILKTRVRACLRQHPAVLAYADAPPADGGSGAVYVLLRR